MSTLYDLEKLIKDIIDKEAIKQKRYADMKKSLAEDCDSNTLDRYNRLMSHSQGVIHGAALLFMEYRTFVNNTDKPVIEKFTRKGNDLPDNYCYSYSYRDHVIDITFDDYGQQNCYEFDDPFTNELITGGFGGESMFEAYMQEDIMLIYDKHFINSYLQYKLKKLEELDNEAVDM